MLSTSKSMQTVNPCTPDCPDRWAECRRDCQKLEEYQASLAPARARRERERMLDGYQVSALRDNRRRYGWTKRRKRL